MERFAKVSKVDLLLLKSGREMDDASRNRTFDSMVKSPKKKFC
jgi:hypothetical protein